MEPGYGFLYNRVSNKLHFVEVFPVRLIPYLSFHGNAEEVMTYYADVFGGKVAFVQRYTAAPGMQIPEGFEEKVLHGRVEIGEVSVYFSDMDHQVETGNQISLTMEFDTEEQVDRAFELLAKDGTVIMQLDKMFWGAKYGKLVDKYGVHWDLNYQYPAE